MNDDVLITCPRCNDVLDRITVESVEVDKCITCGGLWLDRGELQKLVTVKNRHLVHELSLKSASKTKSTPPSSHLVNLRCPACPNRLSALPIESCAIDRCERCGGLWLDHGELEAAFNALERSNNPSVIEAISNTSGPAKP